MEFTVLLYYKFFKIEDPQKWRDEHQLFCEKREIKGRVFFAHEGINGTVAGTIEACEEYKSFLKSIPGCETISFKEEHSKKVPFEKLKTKVRPYILNMGFKPEDDVDPSSVTGNHLEPHEWRQVLESDADYVLLDIRNNYESEIGHFKGAICPDLEGFTDFPAWVKDLDNYKDKKVLMYCTGGIRCEKYSSLMIKEGFKDVNQLNGGILNYKNKEDGAHFEGKCFVFDDRLAVDINKNSETISKCFHCKEKEDKYINCANMECNKLFIICDDCAKKYAATCSEDCLNSGKNRPYDAENFRIPFRKKGIVFPELGIRQYPKKTTK
jgi:UPF0176 protein